MVNKLATESRKIKFRDDNYAVDSGSRFAEIVPEIPMDADSFVQALTDAIKNEQKKSGKSLAETEKEQKAAAKKEQKRIAEEEKQRTFEKELNGIKSGIVDFFNANKNSMETIKPVMQTVKELGYSNPTEISSVEDAKAVLAATLKQAA